MTPLQPSHPQRGFTLIELTLVIVLLGILSSVGVNMISDSYRSTRMLNNGNANTSSARYAMERMAREIRSIAVDSNTKQPMITQASPSTLSFTRQDVLTQQTVTLSALQNSSDPQFTLYLGSPASGTHFILGQHASAFSLTYFDAAMQVLASNSQSYPLVRFVEIDLTVHESETEAIRLRTLVALRNI